MSKAQTIATDVLERDTRKRTVPITEHALALAFTDRYDGEVRYVNAYTGRHKWFYLSNGEWLADKQLHVLGLIRDICAEAAANCKDPMVARAVASAASIYAVERLCRCDKRLVATPDEMKLKT